MDALFSVPGHKSRSCYPLEMRYASRQSKLTIRCLERGELTRKGDNDIDEALYNAGGIMTEFNDLKHSPIANISLASKELFHSNFLAWVFNTYPTTINAVLSSAGLDKSLSGETVEVTREERNLDLVARIGRRRLLVIENKLKSLPYKEQLDRYETIAKKIEPSRDSREFILLTLTPDDCDRSQLPSGYWRCIDYGTLSTALLEQMPRDASPYHVATVKDYVTFVRCLLHVASDESRHTWNSAGSSLKGGTDAEWLRLHKLNDLFGKRQGQKVAAKVHEALARRFGSQVEWQRPPRHLEASKISVYSGFSNSQPLVGIFCALGEHAWPDNDIPVGIGFQVQGEQFRSYIEWPRPGHLAQKPNEGSRPSKTAAIAWDLFCDERCPVSFWPPGRESGPEDESIDERSKKRRHKTQCRFGVQFQYRYRPLSEIAGTDVTLDNLAKALIEHAESLLKDLEQIESLLQDHQARYEK